MDRKTKWIRDRVLNGEILSVTFLNHRSSLSAEMAGLASIGCWSIPSTAPATTGPCLTRPQAIGGTPTTHSFTSPGMTRSSCKQVLDLGLSYAMVPWVSPSEEGRRAVSSLRYPPASIRELASLNSAYSFDIEFAEYSPERRTKDCCCSRRSKCSGQWEWPGNLR